MNLLSRCSGRLLLVSYTLLVSATLHAEPVTEVDASTRLQIEKMVQKELIDKGAPSASIAIVLDGHLAYAQAFGNATISPARAAKPEMRYGIGSISKQFLAVAMLMLEGQGRLSLDDKVSKYITDAGPAGDATIRQLLSHTAGIRDYWPQDYLFKDMLTPISHEALLARWAKQPLDFELGSKWQYSNTGYVQAGVIFEKVAGQSLFSFLQANVFTPLKMTSVIDVDTGALAANDATGYTSYGLGSPEIAPKSSPGWLFAMGELAMTAEDLAKWNISIIDQSLLSKSGYQALERETMLNNGVGSHYGLGLDVGMKNEMRVIGHSGEISGFVSNDIIYPENRFAVAVLTNIDANSAAESISDKLSKLLLNKVSSDDSAHIEVAKGIFKQLQQGKIDRSLFSENGNAYFSKKALEETGRHLTQFGAVKSFELTGTSTRGGMITRRYTVSMAKKTVKIVTRTLSSGAIEQYTLASQ